MQGDRLRRGAPGGADEPRPSAAGAVQNLRRDLTAGYKVAGSSWRSGTAPRQAGRLSLGLQALGVIIELQQRRPVVRPLRLLSQHHTSGRLTKDEENLQQCNEGPWDADPLDDLGDRNAGRHGMVEKRVWLEEHSGYRAPRM